MVALHSHRFWKMQPLATSASSSMCVEAATRSRLIALAALVTRPPHAALTAKGSTSGCEATTLRPRIWRRIRGHLPGSYGNGKRIVNVIDGLPRSALCLQGLGMVWEGCHSAGLSDLSLLEKI